MPPASEPIGSHNVPNINGDRNRSATSWLEKPGVQSRLAILPFNVPNPQIGERVYSGSKPKKLQSCGPYRAFEAVGGISGLGKPLRASIKNSVVVACFASGAPG